VSLPQQPNNSLVYFDVSPYTVIIVLHILILMLPTIVTAADRVNKTNNNYTKRERKVLELCNQDKWTREIAMH
jgi:hypothetical protein